MLLQSHAGEILLLPALPQAWQQGGVAGLLARGGLTVGMQWRKGKLVRATLSANREGQHRIRYGTQVATLSFGTGSSMILNERLKATASPLL